MNFNRRDSEWEWHRAEAISNAFRQFALNGKIVIVRPFTLLLFSMFYDDMIKWCAEHSDIAAFHAGEVGLFAKLKYIRYENKLTLTSRNDRSVIGEMFYNDISMELLPLAKTLLAKHKNTYPDITVDVMFCAANEDTSLFEAKKRLDNAKRHQRRSGLS